MISFLKSLGLHSKSSAEQAHLLWNGDGYKPLTEKQYQSPIISKDKQAYLSAPSFSDYLNPCMDIAGKYVLMKDLKTVGMMFELSPLSMEGRSLDSMADLFERAAKTFSNTLPEAADGNWVLQFFLEDEQTLEPLLTQLLAYIPDELLETEYTQDWLKQLETHLKQVGQERGLFFDKVVSNSPWRGRMRRVRCCLWKHTSRGAPFVDSDIDQVVSGVINALAQSGTVARVLRPVELYAWLSRWFVPSLGEDCPVDMTVEQYLRTRRWQPNNLALFGDKTNDISVAALHGVAPKSDVSGNWFFRDRPTRFITLEEPADTLPIGVLTGEQTVGKHKQVLWDAMPPGSVFSMTIVIQNQEYIVEHIQRVKHNSVGESPVVMAKRSVADEVIENMANGEKIHRLFAGIFIKGDNENDLKSKCSSAVSLLNSYNLRTIPPDEDALAQDSFIRALPFGFDVDHDRREYVKRSRFWYSSEIAKLAPVFGRSTGTGTPGLVFYNRGADPLTLDILSKDDRKRNSHALILGPTGSGKTSLIIYILLQLIAVHKPRIFLISALPTFNLFVEHLKRLNLSVNYIQVGEDKDISLPPFIDAQAIASEADKTSGGFARDIMSDLELQAVLMITGGDPNEEAMLRRSDRTLIRKAIKIAIDVCKDEQRPVLTEDVVKALYQLSEQATLDEMTKRSLSDKARAMELFCSGFAGDLFNRPGELWSDADVTVFELGPLASESAKDYLSVAVTSLLAKINMVAQRDQNEKRQMLTIIDEAHILLKNPLIAPYLNNITAMWRTFGSWLWIATQTLKQFPQSSQELLQQPEWWICMTMDQGEVSEIARFKNLSSEEKDMLLASQKESGKFTEGVILSDRLKTLFRNVVPSLALALAQTEKHEKAARAERMKQYDITEIEAAYQIAGEITKQRMGGCQ